MKKTEAFVGFIGIAVLLLIMWAYQKNYYLHEVEQPVLEETEPEEQILRGYKDPEEIIVYILTQIREGNLDRALRGCAISDVSGNFYMQTYLNFTENFKGMDMIPPADFEDEAYCEIGKLRLTYDYAVMIQKCMDMIPDRQNLKIYEVVVDEPENPDGKYYMDQATVQEILGATKVCETIAYIEAGSEVYEMHFSLARFGSRWKVLLFNTMKNYERVEPDIRISTKKIDKENAEFMELEEETVLPLNYDLILENSAEDSQKLLDKFLIYLQRGDLLSALTFFDYGNQNQEPVLSLELLERQRAVAVRFQEMYYQLFLPDENGLAWAGRHYEDEPEYIPDALQASRILYASCWEPGQVDDSGVRYQIGFSYGNRSTSAVLTLSGENGWKIVSIE